MASATHGNNATAARLAPQVRVTDKTSAVPEKETPVRFEISDLNF
jgi:hypothetical protein